MAFIAGIALISTGIIGYVVTESVVPDLSDSYSGEERRIAQTALRAAMRCLENPLQRLFLQKIHVTSLERGANSAGVARDARGLFTAKVTGYTLYALPIAEITVESASASSPGNCVLHRT